MFEHLVAAAILTLGGHDTHPPKPLKGHVPSQRGFEPAEYQGRYRYPNQEGVRRCITQREGQNVYWITDPPYYGTYQMTKALGVGAAWMIQKELRQMFGDKRGIHIGRTLRAHTPDHWNRYYSDMAWYTVYNWKHRSSGAHHWAGGNWSCHDGMTWKPAMGWYGANS